MRSIRRELAECGVCVDPARELAECDPATRVIAFSAVQLGLDDALPEQLLESLETFDDLAHFVNLRRQQEGLGDLWIE